VVLDGDRIGADASGAKMVVNGAGAVLLPGLTDAHLHLDGRSALERLVRFGVTTALDMANAPPGFVDSMRGIRGLTDIRSAGTAALAPGSIHSHIPEIGERGLIRTAGDAERFVTERFAEGSDFLKILIDLPGPSPAGPPSTRSSPPRTGWGGSSWHTPSRTRPRRWRRRRGSTRSPTRRWTGHWTAPRRTRWRPRAGC
jgi:hypothetical protein